MPYFAGMTPDTASPTILREAQEEFHHVLDVIKTKVGIKRYKQRFLDGCIDGGFIVEEGCGCILGSAYLSKHPGVNNISYDTQALEFFQKEFPGSICAADSFMGIPVEHVAFEINLGDTPENNDWSKWCVDQIEAYQKGHE